MTTLFEYAGGLEALHQLEEAFYASVLKDPLLQPLFGAGQPVVHFEIIGKDPEKLRNYYGNLFGWTFDTSVPVSGSVSEPGNYGFVDRNATSDEVGIPGGVGGGRNYEEHVIFYVGVPNVEAALQKAERLGGTRRMGPKKNPEAALVVGHFTDPEGNLIGVAGPA